MWWKRGLIVVAVLVFIGLMFLPLGFLSAWTYFGHRLSYLHLNRYFTSAISLVFAICFTVAIKSTVSIHRRRRATGRIVLALTIFVWLVANGFAWRQINFTQKGQAAKWYAETPDGIRMFDSPGVDPIWGISLKPLDQAALLRLNQDKNGVPLMQVDPLAINRFFDPRTGQPLMYYSQRANGCLVLFNQSGYDPTDGQALQPVTVEIIRQLYQQNQKKECAAMLNEAFVSGQTPIDLRAFEAYANEIQKFKR